MAALEKPTGGTNDGNRSNIIRFGARVESSPLTAISIESFPFVNPINVSIILEDDTFSRNPDLEVLDYADKATYKRIGIPSGNSSIDSANPADVIASLDIDVFEALRNERLLLVDQNGEYYLMYEYKSTPIQDLLSHIIDLRRAYLTQSKKAMSVNGLKDGVITGKIIDVQDYLTEHHYSYAAKKQELLNIINNISASNFLDYRLDTLIPKEA